MFMDESKKNGYHVRYTVCTRLGFPVDIGGPYETAMAWSVTLL
jgi:hypothetical protein